MSAKQRVPWMTTPTEPVHVATTETGVLDAHRRDFMKLLGMGGLLVVASTFGARRLESADALFAPNAEPWEPHAYVRLGDDGIITIMCHRSEMGQGIRTTMPMIIADEMEADWATCRVEQALGDDKKYGNQNTDGSTSIRDFLAAYREAGATVRALLEDAAAKEWSVASSEVRASNGAVVHTASGRTKSYASLVGTARTIPMPAKTRVRIKVPSERRWEGKRMPSVDLVPMTTGTAMYGADMTLPGMKVAVISRPPVWGGKVVSVDDSLALKVPGVERVVRIPESPLPSAFFPLGGVAVIAKNTWAAIRGRDALRITWEGGPNATYDSTAYKATLLASVRAPGKAGRAVGDVPKALAGATKRVTAEYYMPHLSHAQMEPVVALKYE